MWKEIIIKIKYEDKPLTGGDFEKVCNWLSEFPLEEEKIDFTLPENN